MSNIRDIAQAAKVSVTTVSRVLNNHPHVAKEKREAVLQAIQQLNYRPNINAVHLSRGKTMVVGILCPFINHSYYAALLEGIAEKAHSLGYKLMIIQTYYQRERELEALEMLKHKQMDSLIVLSRILSLNQYEEYLSYGRIVMCEKIEHKGFQSIYIDQYSAFQCAFEFLVQKGHENIGYSTGREMGYSSNQREKAYIEGLATINQNIKKEWVFTNSFFLEDGKKLLKNLLELNKLPTALIVTNDMVAAGIILESKKRRIEIPNNLSIIGFNNDPIAEAMGITTISLPLKDMGSQAFEYSSKKDITSPIKVSFSLLERNTVQ
ncbi:LacI family DNA-binding transcriptional regulator [Priestia megaterium]|uniref:LacI family DNA-binding transcriptional regulator n=1 Tax=Priestia megaterium TaxID=1404 RepID=UPI0026E3300D|nr:LacI family DNA-binding transcriptional regulator [Priestia megaterium]MDO6849767.1 LacI family DNA-binding transcriptional regulator [Priestia megaterium]